MPVDFLIYGANGFVGSQIARQAVQLGLKPILAGRNAEQVKTLAAELGVGYRVFDLGDASALDEALDPVTVVLHCAGPYAYTSKQMVDACLRTGKHYLDLTGEIQVYQAIALRDEEAKSKRVMLLPGVGFDVVPTDCLALHLKQRLPSATRLALAWLSQGAVKLPPGTANTMLDGISRSARVVVRRNGKLESVSEAKQRMIDFGAGPVKATRGTWGDVFTAYYSTGIPNIESYLVLPDQALQGMKMLSKLGFLLRLPAVRNFIASKIPSRPTAEERARSRTFVWGEVEDDQGRKAAARLRGPEAGVNWTSMAALAVVKEVLAGHAPPGFQTPAKAYGPDFALQESVVMREDIG